MNKQHVVFGVSRQRAFTLIELLVVISIISLLSSVVFSSVNTARVKARDSRRAQDMVQLRNALNLYASSNGGSYPAGDYWSHFTSTGSTIYEWSDFAALLVPTYIPVLPIDPQNSSNYHYFYSSNFRSSMISGANGEEGTCLGKKLLMIRALEGSGPFRRDCSFSATLTAAYPKAALIVVE